MAAQREKLREDAHDGDQMGNLLVRIRHVMVVVVLALQAEEM